MAGHSKWANIQHRKGRQDARRGKLFTKLIREITVAARLGGADISQNPRLRAAVDNGLSNNMTRETIERAINRGAGGYENGNLDEYRYEGYAPCGVAVLVTAMSDNKNRTVSEVRHAFSKFGGNLGIDGSVAYLFTEVGLINFTNAVSEEAIIDIALENGAEDLITHPDNSVEVMTKPHHFVDTKQALIAAGFNPASAEITMQAATNIELDQTAAERVLKLLEALEDLDDVQQVYSNATIADEVLAQFNE